MELFEFADPMGHRWPDVNEAIAIVRKGEFDRVQERLSGQRASGPVGDRRRPLVGPMRCASCGSPLVVQSTRGGHQYYRCRNALSGFSDETYCVERPIRAGVLERFVREMISGSPFVDEVDGGSVGGSS